MILSIMHIINIRLTFVINLSDARSCQDKHQTSTKYLNVDKKEIKLTSKLRKDVNDKDDI